jgi:hypothetical protein
MFKKLALALALTVIGGAAGAAGLYGNYPLVGNTQNTANPPGPTYSTTCESFGNNGVCNQFQPYGPTYLQGTEAFPADTNYTNSQGAIQPYTVAIPTSLFGAGYGNTQVVTTAASVPMANGTSVLLSTQGVATIPVITLPPNPMNNMFVRIVNAGSGVLTTPSIIVGTAGQSIVQGAAPASIATQTNNAAAAAETWVGYVYQASNSTWYRFQ